MFIISEKFKTVASIHTEIVPTNILLYLDT